MNELQKTSVFVVLAVVVAAAAYFVRPSRSFDAPESVVGSALVEQFNPAFVAGMEIVKFDPRTGKVDEFKVEQVEVHGKLRWSIPSHSNYPADAKDQVVQAAKSLMDLKILGVASEDDADQETFGVVDPDPERLPSGAKGVGMRVTLSDRSGKTLISLIIGDEVKDQPGQRYVRLAGKPAIYTVAVNTSNLVTDFDHWIEKNLLDVNPWDIRRLWLSDYSTALLLDRGGRLGVDKQNRGEIVLDFDDRGETPWKLVEDRVVNAQGELTPVKMTDDEELNVAKLNELKTALGDLKIVDVVRKPEGLSADLKAAADFTNNEESMMTLLQRGFIIAQAGDHVVLYSKEGEVRCLMNDGVEYVLRFGNVAAENPTGTGNPENGKKGEHGTADDNPLGLNRYLFVMAEFNPQAIEKPKYEPLPEVPAPAKAPPDKKTPANPAEEKKATKKAEKNAAEKKETAPSAAEKDAPAEIPVLDLKTLKVETERIKKENQRKEDEYTEKIEKGKKHVAELNHRFADWYYIISDAEYRKIHLSRGDVIQKKEKKEESKDAVKTPGAKKAPIPAKESAGK